MKQSNIVTEPNKKLYNLKINFSVSGKPVSFDIITNVKENEMYAVLENWFARTNKYTQKSLINYINTKNKYGFQAVAP